MLGHNGQFGNFLKEVREQGGMQAPLMDQTGLPVSLLGFDGSPVYDDTAVLQRWLQTIEKDSNPRSATFLTPCRSTTVTISRREQNGRL
jgi:hypothetical protein